MMDLFKRRKLRKTVVHTLRHARHVRNMQEDIMDAADLQELLRLEEGLRAADEGGNTGEIVAACEALHDCLGRVRPPQSFPVAREYVELVAVALAVALGFRTYFIQPFKMPTGSMQPSLYGITSWQQDQRGVTDHWPLKPGKWALTGQWYRKVVVRAPGHLGEPRAGGPYNQWDFFFDVAGRTYKVPRDAVRRGELRFIPGSYVRRGDLLWSGVLKAGDHVFVDRVRWNFVRPRHGQVSVFATDGIATLPPDTHYIKRMIGLPGDTVSIDPPNVLIHGEILAGPYGIDRVSSAADGYHASMRTHQLRLIQRALQQTEGNQSRAAELLGLQRTYLSRLMKNLGLR